MEFEFSTSELTELYTKGKCRKLKFLNTKAVDNFFDCIQNIEAAESIQDWWKRPAMHFEKLQGSGDQFSMRIDCKHRLKFKIDFEDKERTRGFVSILEISKHYK
ncbi:MAG: type II toxin-antitoxin system RelE/ParE family toxin [Lentisphaeria bacterium]